MAFRLLSIACPSAAPYHAGAVAASNYLVALIDYATRLLQTLGADRQEALRAVPLAREQGSLTDRAAEEVLRILV
jgi:predicted short-subunit dehydrogenase-like oxidoreductase (DUF2520 family)